MAKLIISGNDIGYTIIPYSLEEKSVQEELSAHPHDSILGFVTRDIESGKLTFTYTESGKLTEVDTHWSLDILKEFPYCEETGPWIVYTCSPEKTRRAFGKILSKYAQSLHIHNWDIWSVEEKTSKVAVITSWERY